MNASERRRTITELAKKNKELTIEQLQLQFGVSDVTLRRDLDILESQGYLRRVRGGAVLNSSPQLEIRLQEKLGQNNALKREIAKVAASLVEDGQVVMLSGGTTTQYIARELCQKKDITIVTPAINIATEVVGYDTVNLVVIGGIVRRNSYVASGHMADEALITMNADYAFVGVDGVDILAGFTTPNLMESRTDRTMLHTVTQPVIVADHSKFEKVAFSPVARLDEVALLITDSEAPENYIEQLQEAGCKVLSAHRNSSKF
ncbi:DeoR/GlpR family DNA-binding transcription regulator [Alicyclobacillus fodiniaquatilis]|uniref:DeoR/GlpR family DNA-binding transcription regulator n=1 Tax=Alicyclobacillus fodiniaquatilis TaxID=1661150 RepID=A0ABW4JJH5_9BACL